MSSSAAARPKIALEGTLNTRDLGGYVGRDGAIVREGAVFRSDNLAGLTDADREWFRTAGISRVVDYRGPEEAAAAPSALPEGLEPIAIPMANETAITMGPMDRILAGTLTHFDAYDMTALYVDMLARFATDFGRVVTMASEADTEPLLFHCTAGKDRTGVTAALILDVLGVDRDAVLADYEISTTYRGGRRLAELHDQLTEAGVDVDAVSAMFGAPIEAMAATMRFVDGRHGGAEKFLTDVAGVSPASVERLRTIMLT